MNETINNRNVEDVFLRNCTIGLLDKCNKAVNIEQYYDDEPRNFKVPVYYNNAADENFMRDFFIKVPKGCKIPQAEGNYDKIPRGILTLQNFQVKTGDITNKFVRGTFRREERGDNNQPIVNAYSARLFSLPLLISYELKFRTGNLNQTMKIVQGIWDELYKNNVYFFQYRGIRIPGQAFFDDTQNYQKKTPFSYTDKNKLEMTLNVELETYYPSFDRTTEFHRGNTIRQILAKKSSIDTPRVPFDSSFTDDDFPPSE